MQEKLVFVVNKASFFLSHRLNIALKAKKEGLQVHLISDATREDLEKIKKNGIIFHQIFFSRTYKNIFLEIKTLVNLFFIYLKIKPSLIHHVTIKPIIYGNIICKLINHKKIVNSISGLGYIFVNKTIHDSFFFLFKRIHSNS